MFYKLAGGISLSAIEPIFTAAGCGETKILYVQGSGDAWGSIENVSDMVDNTPNAAEPIFFETGDRFEGYAQAIDNAEIIGGFFRQQFEGD
jgi:hypothetical protein